MRPKPNVFIPYLLALFFMQFSGYTLGQSFEWANSVQSKNNVLSERITADIQGNVYTLGFFWDTVDVDPGPSITQFISIGQSDLYIQKLDSNGKFLWAKHLGTPDYDHPQDIVTDGLGNVYISGNFGDSIDIDPGFNQNWLYSSGHEDGFVLKLDNNGDYVWSIQIGGKSVDGCNSLAIDTASNLVIGGRFAGTVDLNPGPGVNTFTSTGGANAFIEKLDANGKFLWAKHLKSNHNDLIERVRIDNDNNIYCAGWMLGTTDFDPDTATYSKTTHGKYDVFICQYDEDGKFNWARTFGGTDNDYIRDLVLDDSNYLYLVGDFEGTVDFDPDTSLNQFTSNGRADVYISKYSSTGDYKFTKTIGGSSYDFGSGIGISILGDLMISGTFLGTVDMDPNAGTANLSSTLSRTNGFVLKLTNLGTYKWASVLGTAYPMRLTIDHSKNTLITGYFKDSADVNPNSGIYRIKSTGLNDGFVFKLDGCIQTETNLEPIACKSYVSPSGKYTWTTSGKYRDTVTTKGGCDSIFIIDLKIQQSNTHQVSFDWAKEISASRQQNVMDFAQSDSESIVVTGLFRDSITFSVQGKDTVIYGAGDNDIYIQKLNSKGETLWYKWIGGRDHDTPYALAVDDSGAIYLGGSFYSNMDFDPGSGTQNKSPVGWNDMFLLKLTSNGDFVWVHTFGSTLYDQINDLVLDANENLIITGVYTGTVDFDPGTGTKNLTNYGSGPSGFALKLSKDAKYIWGKAFGTDDYTMTNEVFVDASGSCYVTGEFRRTSDFDPGSGVVKLTSAGDLDAFIIKLNNQGNLTWVRSIGGIGADVGNAIQVDGSGFVHIAGSFSDRVDFDPSVGIKYRVSKGSADAFVLRLDSNGFYRWVAAFGDKNLDEATGLIVDDLDQIYCSGFIAGTVDFNTNGISSYYLSAFGTGHNVFVAKYKPNSDFVFAKLATYGASNFSNVLDVNKDGDIFVAGAITGSTDFDPGIGTYYLEPSFGRTAGYVSKLEFIKCCTSSTSNLKLTRCGTYKSPSDKYIWDKTGTYYDTILNLSRCDSLLTIDLTIKRQDDTSLSIVACDEYLSPGGEVWRNSGIYTETLVNSEGCDSIIRIDLTIKKNSRTIEKNTVCNQLVSPSGKYQWTSSGKYLDTLPSANGCDSIILIDLTVNRLERTYYQHHCGPVISPSGKYTWTTDGLYLDTIVDAAGPGCDSFYQFNLTFGTPSSERVSVSNCVSYTSPSGKHTWNTSGTYHDTIVNANKCDSLLTIDLTILEPTLGLISPQECYEYESPSGMYTWNKSGVYYDTIMNTMGCDSFLTIDLTILESTSGKLSPEACLEYTSPSARHVWTSSGVYSDTIQNQAGCDSFLTIDLTIKTVDTSVTQHKNLLISNAANSNYQWLDCDNNNLPVDDASNRSFYAKSIGKYAVAVEQGGCLDTSSCILVDELSNISNQQPGVIKIYPNPITDHINLVLPNRIKAHSITIYDELGRKLVFYSGLIDEYMTIPFTYGPGLYTISIESELGVTNHKLIKLNR